MEYFKAPIFPTIFITKVYEKINIKNACKGTFQVLVTHRIPNKKELIRIVGKMKLLEFTFSLFFLLNVKIKKLICLPILH